MADGVSNTISSSMSASMIIAILVNRRCRDITSYLDLGKCGRSPISGGGFGDIYSGVLIGGERVAIKCARLYIQQDDANGHKVLKHAARELDIWSRLQHRNILELLGLAQFRDQMAMISPWMDQGTLLQYLGRNPAADRYQLCVDISEGVAYLHQNGTVHGDIKGANILISGEGVAQLADFGCTELKVSTLCFTTTTSGSSLSMRWAAPEMLKGGTRSKETDVYALGMVLIETVTGKVPFSNLKEDVSVCCAVAMNQKMPERPNKFPSFSPDEANQLWRIIVDSCAHDSPNRPGSTTIRDRLHSIRQHARQLTLDTSAVDSEPSAIVIEASQPWTPTASSGGEDEKYDEDDEYEDDEDEYEDNEDESDEDDEREFMQPNSDAAPMTGSYADAHERGDAGGSGPDHKLASLGISEEHKQRLLIILQETAQGALQGPAQIGAVAVHLPTMLALAKNGNLDSNQLAQLKIVVRMVKENKDHIAQLPGQQQNQAQRSLQGPSQVSVAPASSPHSQGHVSDPHQNQPMLNRRPTQPPYNHLPTPQQLHFQSQQPHGQNHSRSQLQSQQNRLQNQRYFRAGSSAKPPPPVAGTKRKTPPGTLTMPPNRMAQAQLQGNAGSGHAPVRCPPTVSRSLPPDYSSQSTRPETDWDPNLPGATIMAHLVDLFLQKEPCSARILHRSTFVASLSLPTTHPDFPPVIILHSICCAASRWASHGAPSRQERFSEFHATKTRSLLDAAVRNGSTDLATFQASIILQYWAYAEGRNLDIKISPHPFLESAINNTHMEEKRRAWWSFVMFDRYVSLGARKHTIPEADIMTLELPICAVDFECETLVSPNPQKAHDPSFFLSHQIGYTDPYILLIKANLLFGKVTDYNLVVDSRSSPRSADPRDTAVFRAPDRLVAVDFLQSLPVEYKSCLGVGDNPDGSMVDPDLYLVHVLPYAATISLHNAHIDYSSPECPSAVRCIQAARSIIRNYYLLSGALFDFKQLHPFVTVCWYLAAVVLVQLCKRHIITGDRAGETTAWGEIETLKLAMVEFGNISPIGLQQEKLLQEIIDDVIQKPV